MVAGLILITGVFEIYVFSRQTYRSQDSESRIQEEGRLVLDQLVRDLRQAGHQGCRPLQAGVPAVVATPPLLAFDAINTLRGHLGGPTSWQPALPTDLANLSTSVAGLNPVPGTDVLTVQYGEACGARLTADMTARDGDLVVADNNRCGFDTGHAALVADCQKGDIFRVSGIAPVAANNTQKLSHVSPVNSVNLLSKNYTIGTDVLRLQARSYFVGTQSGQYSLWRFDHTRPVGGDNPTIVADNVETMKLRFGIDSNGDRLPNQYVSADLVADWRTVGSVRIDLLFRSQDDRITTSPERYDFNGASLTAPDRRMRREFSTTVALRNRLL